MVVEADKKEEPVKKRRGRKRNDVDLEQLRKIMQFKPSLAGTAAYFQVDEKTILRIIAKIEKGLSFSEFRNRYVSKTRISIIQKLIQMALAGNVTAAIYCSKNLCGWSDNPMIEDDEQNDIEWIKN